MQQGFKFESGATEKLSKPGDQQVPADGYDYDVCLSFAGEQRDYVEQVARRLIDSGLRVFYDLDEQAKLWGKDLYEHLDDVYRNKAKYCLLFISQE